MSINPDEQIIEISADGATIRSQLAELWSYRELLFVLAWRDATVRYKQSIVGIGWAVLQPLMMMMVFTVIFGRFAQLPSDGVPYTVFTLTALLPWNYFSRALGDSSNSIVGASHLVTKIYFPRLILPLSRVLAGLLDFAVAFGLLGILLVYYRIRPSAAILLLPLFLVFTMSVALAAGLWLTALNVKYRDVGFVVPFLIQVWMYASPVAYSTSIIPDRWRWFYALNPIVGVVECFRWAILDRTPPSLATILPSLVLLFLTMATGLLYFRRMERTFADII